MNKLDLKDGMLIETAAGEVYLYVNQTFIGAEGGFMTLGSYDDDLKVKGSKAYDIQKVSAQLQGYRLRRSHWTSQTIDIMLMWERPIKIDWDSNPLVARKTTFMEIMVVRCAEVTSAKTFKGVVVSNSANYPLGTIIQQYKDGYKEVNIEHIDQTITVNY